MATSARPSISKRQKELRRAEKQREKQERKRQRAENKTNRGAEGEDPDIAGIVPGPQPPPEDDLPPAPELPSAGRRE